MEYTFHSAEWKELALRHGWTFYGTDRPIIENEGIAEFIPYSAIEVLELNRAVGGINWGNPIRCQSFPYLPPVDKATRNLVFCTRRCGVVTKRTRAGSRLGAKRTRRPGHVTASLP